MQWKVKKHETSLQVSEKIPESMEICSFVLEAWCMGLDRARWWDRWDRIHAANLRVKIYWVE